MGVRMLNSFEDDAFVVLKKLHKRLTLEIMASCDHQDFSFARRSRRLVRGEETQRKSKDEKNREGYEKATAFHDLCCTKFGEATPANSLLNKPEARRRTKTLVWSYRHRLVYQQYERQSL